MRRASLTALALAALLSWTAGTARGASLPPIKHVFIVVLENEDADSSFGAGSKAPYLAHTLTSQGEFLKNYYGTGHESLDNYITMVSGQPPNPVTQADCQSYQDFIGTVGSDGVAVGQGCVYPAAVKTIADQLEAKGLTWKGYMQDMAASSTDPKTCRHPDLNAQDQTQSARVGDQYAARHNPFVYFHSIIDRPICAANDVDLNALPGDLAAASTTPSYSFIVPDLCEDGHDSPCVDGRPGGLESADEFLKTWIPKITGSPAYADGGLVIVTFDEAGGDDAGDCCGEPMGPNTPNNGGPTPGNGGGRIGAVLLSPYIKAGSVNETPYNHYSLLRSTEDLFGLPHLAYAAKAGLKPFEEDVFNQPSGKPTPSPAPTPGGGPYPKPKITIRGTPKRCVKRAFKPRVKVKSKHLRNVIVMVDRHKVVMRKSKSLRPRISVKRLKHGHHLLSVRATDAKRRQSRKTVVFTVCR
jgi:hypothetical protein